MTPCLRLVPVAVAVMWNPLIPSSAAACPARPVTPEALLMYTLILSGVIVSTGPAVLIGVGAGVVPGRGVSSRIDFHNASAAGSIALGYGPGDSPRPARRESDLGGRQADHALGHLTQRVQVGQAGVRGQRLGHRDRKNDV